MVYGVGCMVYGVWCMVYGVGCMVYGVWWRVEGDLFSSGGERKVMARCDPWKGVMSIASPTPPPTALISGLIFLVYIV